MINLPFLISLNDKEKKMLIFLIIIVALVFVIVGLIYNGIKALSKKMGKGIDLYVSELCRYKVIKSPNELIECVKFRERKSLYINNRFIMRTTLLCAIATVLLFHFFLNDDYSLIGVAFDNLKLDIVWQRGSFFGIENFITGWPTQINYPHPSFDLYSIITYTDLIVAFILIIFVIKSLINYRGRVQRAKSVAAKVFNQDLDTANFALE